MNFLRRVKKSFLVFRLPYEVLPPYTHVVQIGDPILRKHAELVNKDEITTEKIQKLIKLMKTIMKNDDLVGISAPQVGISLSIIIIKLFGEIKTMKSKKKNELFPYKVYINPIMKILDYDFCVDNEQCASVLSFAADVKRYKKIELVALNESGEKVVLQASDLHARIIQHEMDHLGGILFTDLMIRKSLKCVLWDKINDLNGYVELRYCPRA